MYVTNIKNTKELKTPSGKSIWWLLPKEIGTPNFEMRYFEVKKGIESDEEKHPFEHEVFVVKGEGIIKSGGIERRVKSGDAVFIAPNEPHQFLNFKENPFGFICVIPNGCEDDRKESK